MEVAGVALSCLDQVRVDFKDVYENPELSPAAESGLKFDFQALYDDCKAELDEFKVDVETEMQAQITTYEEDALKQEHKAKADFLRLIEASIIKLHGITSLTGAKKVELKEAIVNKREAFGDDVEGWATALIADMNLLLSQEEDLTADPEEVKGLMEIARDKIDLFEDEMLTNDIDANGDPTNSLTVELMLYNEE